MGTPSSRQKDPADDAVVRGVRLGEDAPVQRFVLDGVPIAYRIVGDGPPVVLVHAAGLADFFAPLLDSSLSQHARIIAYHRVGYGQSGAAVQPTEIADQARQCRALMHHLGYPRAHVVGHSSGGVIGIELALRSPEAVATLSLLEPSLRVPGSAKLAVDVMQPAFAAYLAGDRAKAVDTFLAGVCGPDYPGLVDRVLSVAARVQAVADADTLFGVEAPSVGRWNFAPEMLKELGMPVLAVLGERSDEVSPVSREAHELLLENISEVEGYQLPRATHLLQLQNPEDLAEALADFIERHPL